MSHLRAPAATRADRREGGRHGRPGSRAVSPLPEAHIRPQLLRIAVLPAVAVSLAGSAAVLFALRSTDAHPNLLLWAVLAGAGAVALAGIAAAAVAADRTAKHLLDRVSALRRTSARNQADLRTVVDQLRRGDPVPVRRETPRTTQGGDGFDLLADELTRSHDVAVTAVVQAAQLSSHAGSEQKVEVFVNLARRLQSLVHREIQLLDDLENQVEDPDLLKGLFHVDHLSTRIRRHAENLAVLGGAMSRRQWSHPVSMTEVLRSAIAEVEQYSRVKLVPPIDGEVRGHAVADTIHLLAELVENATVFSAPHTQVLLRASRVASGLAVEVEDRGLGMPVTEQNKMNALLADPDQVNVASLLQDGRIGLYVVSALARRHGITVRLQTNIYGGTQAVLVLPANLLGTEPGEPVGTQRNPAAAGAAEIPPPTDGPAQLTAGGTGQHPAAVAATAEAPDRQGAGSRLHFAGDRPHQDPPGATPATGPGRPPAPRSSGRHAGPRQSPAGRSATRQTRPEGPPPPLPSRNTGHQDRTSEPVQGPPPAAPEPPAELPDTPSPARPVVPDPAGVATSATGEHALPVRGALDDRPNPAEALPGIRPEHRGAVAENANAPFLVHGAVRGTMERPRLPKRRAQEHLVPQLRETPVPRDGNEPHVGHDPGLMAAFQRGVGLAEAQNTTALDADVPDAVVQDAAVPDPETAWEPEPVPEPDPELPTPVDLERHSTST